jgi:hypothetical protein
MKLFIRIFLVFLFFTAAIGLSAQKLWNGSEYGMTTKQVSDLFPAAKVPEKPEKLSGGLKELLTIDAVNFSNHRYCVSFFFKEEKLVLVRLALQEKRDYDNARLVFDATRKELTTAYGADSFFESKPGKTRATWSSGTTVISLSVVEGSSNVALLDIQFGIRQ